VLFFRQQLGDRRAPAARSDDADFPAHVGLNLFRRDVFR
jgi:hypothetical protein